MEKLVDNSNVFDLEAIATSIDDLHTLGFDKNVSFSSFSSNSSGSTIIGSDNSLNNDDFYGGKRTDSIIIVERRKNGCDNTLSKEVSDGDFDGAERSNSIIVVAGSKNGSENRLSREISDCDFDDSVVVIEGSENGFDDSLSWEMSNCNFGGGRRGDSSIVVEETKNGVDFIDCVESERSSLSSLSCSNSIQAIEASFDPEAIATAINDLHQLRFKKNVSFGNCTSSSNSSSSSTVTGSGNSLSRKFDNGDSDGGKMDDSVIAVSKQVVDFIDCVESEKSSTDEGNEASFRSICPSKPHKGNNIQWDTIQCLRAKDGEMGLAHFRLLKKLGCGDIGSVYLAELRGMVGCLFAMKVMDKGMLAEKKKLLRAQTEREILGLLDHPFLPTLYSHFETDKFSCLLMEFCSGGDLHMLRQRQQGKHFSEQAARFYASEVLLALEYLHMMGVVYRDLKPENVLVREDGHIMLSDFDLSLRCYVNPTLIQSSIEPSSCRISCNLPHCVEPPCLQPSCFRPGLLTLKPTKTRSQRTSLTGPDWFPVLVAEPTTARSMSFVGTHEYLAPEIIKGDGHGSAVDGWTFGIFLYELLHGRTPFKGKGNRETLFNVVGQSLKFPEGSSISVAARDLIRGLLAKDPKKRLGFKRGATEIKQHPFFGSVSWALIRSIDPPEMPKPFDLEFHKHAFRSNTGSNHSLGPYLDFEFF